MKIKFNPTKEPARPTVADMTFSAPAVLKQKNGEGPDVVVIRLSATTEDGSNLYLFFEEDSDELLYSDGLEFVEENYEFVRYLRKSESVTFYGLYD